MADGTCSTCSTAAGLRGVVLRTPEIKPEHAQSAQS
jgi:hypothetical protein